MQVFLNQKSKETIKKITGLTYDQIISMEIEDIESSIERKNGKKLDFRYKKDSRLPSRGSVYLSLNRFFHFNHKKMDKFIDSLSVD